MESRSKKSGRTPKKSSAKTKGKKKATEKDSEPLEKISLLQSCLNNPQTSVLAPNIEEEDSKEISLRSELFKILIDTHYSNDKQNSEVYPILDQLEGETDIDMVKEMSLNFNDGSIPENYKKYVIISDKKYYINDHPVNKYQSINTLLRYFILHQLHKLDFDKAQDQALDILTDVTRAFIERVGFLANSFASIPGSVQTPIDIMKKTFLELYPKGIHELKNYVNSLKKDGDKMEIEQTNTNGQQAKYDSAKNTKDELDETSMNLLKRDLFLMKSPFVKRKKQSYSALYKDAFRTNTQSLLSSQARVASINRQMNPGMKTFESPYQKYNTPQTTDKRKRSDFSYDEEDLSSSSRLRRTRSTRINYSEEYDDEDYGDDLDDEGPKKKKRKSSTRSKKDV